MRRFDLIVTCVCFALLGYFAWHAWKGPRGYPLRDKLVAQVNILETKFEAERKARVQMESKASLLRPESIDPDILDEMARLQLLMAHPGDFVAYTSR